MLLRLLGIVVVALLVAAAFQIFSPTQNKTIVTATPSPTQIKGNTTYDEPSPAAATPTTNVATASSAAPLAKPTLQKSSGNAPGSSVPTGAMIEFTCEGTAGLSCEVILTSAADASNVLNLGKKPISSNGRGQYFTLSDWTAKQGSWIVAAKMSDGAGRSSTSSTQTLEVK